VGLSRQGKGWQARNPSYMKEPKIKILAIRGIILIGLQSSSKTNAIYECEK
jgi:hypothetical protein